MNSISEPGIEIPDKIETSSSVRAIVINLLYAVIAVIGILLIGGFIDNVQYSLNSDTYINSILHPYLSVADHSLINEDFIYSNGDHRLIGISVFHTIPAMFFPDDPWAVYFWGAMLRSTILIGLMTYICKLFDVGIILTFAIIMFIAVPTGYQYLEHVHAQGSYIFTHYLIPIVVLSTAFHLKSLRATTVTGISPATTEKVRISKSMMAIAACIILALILNAPRGLVTVVAPLLGAYCLTVLWSRTSISKSVITFIAALVVAVLIGLIIYTILKSNLTYTYGASKPFLLGQWRGQSDVLKKMGESWGNLTHWNVGKSKLHFARKLASFALLIYVIIRGALALWRRSDKPGIFVTLYTGAVFATLAIAFNFTDIIATPRYILPILIMMIMSLIVLSRNTSILEKIAVAACIIVFPLTSLDAMPRDERAAVKRAEYNETIYSYLKENEVKHGIATWGYLGLLNLNFGKSNFSPTGFGPDGTLSSSPFGTSFYLRDFQEQTRTALVFEKSHPRDSADLESLSSVLSKNGLNIVDVKNFNMGPRNTVVAIIDGDIRNMQILPDGKPSQIYTPINAKANVKKNISRGEGQTCEAALKVKGGAGEFEYRQSSMLLHEDSYTLRIDFDGDRPENIGELNVVVVGYTSGEITHLPYDSESLSVTIPEHGVYSMWLTSPNPLIDYAICGVAVSN